jgi:inner membrane protein ybhL
MNYDEYNDFDELNNYGHSENRYLTYEEVEKVAASKVRGSILWMVLGLLISGLTGYFTLIGLSNGTVPFLVVPVAFVLEFVAVITFTALTYKASASVLKMIFLVYSVLTGITLSAIGAIYDPYAIISAFTGTVVLFTVLAIYGYVTKEDLSKYRSILMVGLIALIVMGGINFFIQSDGLMWISSMLGVAVFIVFIAYDVNRIKNNVISYALEEDAGILDKIEIHGALALYLDFVNLFLYILRILGRRK